MRFSTPLALLLLLTLPGFYWLARSGLSGPQRWRGRVSLGLRLAIVSLVTLALAGTQAVRAADDLAVVFLVDASDSIAPVQAAEAEAFVRDAVAGLGPNDQAAIVLFGANAMVERPMSALTELAPFASAPQTLGTDIDDAVRLGLALFPPGFARRLVLLSDGAATTGDPLEAAQVAAAAGVTLDVVPLARSEMATEALIVAVDAPTQAVLGETFNIDVSIESTVDMPATLRILGGRELIAEQQVQLRQGANNFPVSLRAAQQAFARYTVQLTPARDTLYQNNEMAAFTDVIGPPRILLVAAAEGVDADGDTVTDDASQLQQALEAAGLEVDRTTPAALPASLATLSNYASLVLVNVNAKDLAPSKMETMATFVRELGGGLVAVGGPESYGVGGYFHTPLEETLPVDMQIKDQDRFPAVSIAIVIDRSGSMSASEGGLTKIQLAGEGAARVVELLNDFDEITIIPVDTQPDNPIGPVLAVDKAAIIGEIRQIGAGGGGIYVRTGLEAAATALAKSVNPIQHVIVLADGADSEQKEGVPELIDALVAGDATISFVSIGNGPDVIWLQEMATRGNGRFHFTDRAANLPQIFTQETTSIQRSYLVEERFFPALAPGFTGQRAILAGITAVPPLYGYVGTSPKDTAQVVLETHLGDPLLAVWQTGLGRAVAWTSDATGRWASDWIDWDGFPAFWAQVVRWTITQNRDSRVETVVSLADERATLTVDAWDAGGAFLNGLAMQANVVDPNGQVESVALDQVAPGRYAGTFRPASEGAYIIRVAGQDGLETSVGQTSGWVLEYSPEYRLPGTEPTPLSALAELTGGRDVGNDPAATVAHDLPGSSAARPIWPWLLLAAVALLPADIAVRRLALTRRDLTGVRNAVMNRLRPEVAAPRPRSEQVARLFAAKQRAGTRQEPDQATTPQAEGLFVPSVRDEHVEDRTIPGEEPRTPSEAAGDTLAARLLSKKRGGSDQAK